MMLLLAKRGFFVAIELLPGSRKLADAPIEPRAHRSLPETVMVELRRIIVNGDIPAGTRLIETELAEKLQVSRATVRQAIRHLEFEGLVEIRPRHGAFVAQMSSKIALEVCQARGVLEGYMARAACLILTPEQIAEMRSIALQMGDAGREGDVIRVAELDIAFHATVCECQPNRRAAGLWATLDAQNTAVLASRLAFHHYDWDEVVALHLTLCDTLASRDPNAVEEATRDHYTGDAWDREELK